MTPVGFFYLAVGDNVSNDIDVSTLTIVDDLSLTQLLSRSNNPYHLTINPFKIKRIFSTIKLFSRLFILSNQICNQIVGRRLRVAQRYAQNNEPRHRCEASNRVK